ncbi:MAG: aldose 1-epimerase [Vicinamibacterales bacterium]
MALTRSLALMFVLVLAASTPARAQQYTATRIGDVVQLAERRSQTVISIITSIGNIAYEMKVNGQNILRFPFASIDEFKAKPTGLHGIPLLAPWANRLDEQAFYANGTRYAFDMQLGNVTGAIPIHGFMSRTDQWQVIEVKADGTAAWVTSRLEAYRQPAWMKQWPFAHTIEMTYRLQDGVLETHTKVTNLAAEPMPVSLGYHPYFQLTDSPRDEWTVTLPARTRWLLNDRKLPTGETEPADRLFPAGKGALKDYNLDDVFSDLARDEQGRATVTLKGRVQQLDVVLGPNYKSLVIYSPNPNPTPNFICFEPMSGITNALNLAHKGVYKDLTYIAPGGTWEERFWLRPSGF